MKIKILEFLPIIIIITVIIISWYFDNELQKIKKIAKKNSTDISNIAELVQIFNASKSTEIDPKINENDFGYMMVNKVLNETQNIKSQSPDSSILINQSDVNILQDLDNQSKINNLPEVDNQCKLELDKEDDDEIVE